METVSSEIEYYGELHNDVVELFKQTFKPSDTRPIYEWAHDNVSLNSGYRTKGKFDCSISPHFKKIFDAIKDPYVREISICAPPRSGKTLVAELSFLHTVANSSGDILWLQVSEEKASDMSDLRMMPLIKSCKPVAELIDPNHKYSITEGRYKFLHTTVHITSPKKFALLGIGYKYIFIDEAWVIKDPSLINTIKDRMNEYKGISKLIVFSQGGDVGSAWHKQFNSGEINSYGWTCPKCSTLQKFEFGGKREDKTKYGLVWPDNATTRLPNGRWIIKECAKQAALECKHCKFQITDEPQNRHYLLHKGDYITSNDNPAIKAFHFGNIFNVIIPFSDLVTRFLGANETIANVGDTKDLSDFIRSDLAEFWDNQQSKNRTEIRLASYDASKPFGEFERFRFLTVDCQDKEPYYYWVCRAWNGNGESRLVSFGTANAWKEIDSIRDRNKVDFRFVFVDTGNGTKTESIYAEIIKYGRWGTIDGEEMWLCYNSLKGSGAKGFRHSDNKWYRYNEPLEITTNSTNEEDEGKSIIHVTWSNFRIKQILETLRDGKGKKWEAVDITDEYTTHLNSEYLERKMKGNTADFEYVQKANTPNHWLDCEAMQCVAADLMGILDAKTEDIQSDS